jgi:hypothetical protein
LLRYHTHDIQYIDSTVYGYENQNYLNIPNFFGGF